MMSEPSDRWLIGGLALFVLLALAYVVAVYREWLAEYRSGIDEKDDDGQW